MASDKLNGVERLPEPLPIVEKVAPPVKSVEVEETKVEETKDESSDVSCLLEIVRCSLVDMQDSNDDADEDEENVENVKARDKSKPISSTPVSGTPWCIVWTGDGRVFFFNPAKRLSVWDRPEDLKERTDVDKILAEPPKQAAEKTDKNELDKIIDSDEPPVKKLKVCVFIIDIVH